MSVARFFSQAFGASSFSISSPDAYRAFGHWGGGRTSAGVFVSERMALNLAGVQCCVRVIADGMAALPASVQKLDERTGTWTAVTDDPREWLLNVEPNEYMTPIVARKATQATMSLWGEACAEVVRNGRGQGVEFWPLEPGAVGPELDYTSGRPRIRYRGNIGGRQFDKEASEVVHLRGITLNGLCGISPVRECREAFGLGFALEQFGNTFFANEGASGGWVEGAKEQGDALANLREYINTQGGRDNHHRVKVLGEGLKFTSGTIPPEDAQFLGTREFSLADFCRMFGVPLELVMAQGKTSSWGSGIEQLILAFVKWTIRPLAIQWEQELSLKLLTRTELEQGLRIRFSVDELLGGDSSARSAYYERMVRMKAMLPNEVRSREGLNPIPGGDEFPEQPAPGGAPGTETPNPQEQENDRQRKEDA